MQLTPRLLGRVDLIAQAHGGSVAGRSPVVLHLSASHGQPFTVAGQRLTQEARSVATWSGWQDLWLIPGL